MASLLQKSTPWIEDSFVYACSFDASRSDEEGNGSDSDFNDNDEEMEPQTENTIPAGLHDDDDDGSHDGNNGRNKPPPSRGGKIVQIIDRGGDPNFYVTEQQQQQSDDNNNNDCCPPYLILHDGQYSTIAFLSEEAYNSSMMRQDVASRGTKQPKAIPRKSLISISQYTISTIKCCAQHNNKDQHHQPKNDHNEDILPLQLVRPDMPRAHLSQVQMSLNTNLLLSLYLLGPITLIGAENQGLIGNTINVNCSIKVRRVLISHMAQFDRVHKEHTDVCVNIEEEEEEEDYQHWTMVQRLEACHCYYQLLKERQGGTIPTWPWESRLVGGEMDDDGAKEDNDSANDNVGIVDVTVKPATATAAIAASPGRVERMIQKYENLEELLREDDNEEEEEDDDADVAEAAAVGDKRAGRASTGTYLAKWDSEEEQVEEEEEDVGDTADAIGDKRATRASTGTYLAKWDSEEDQEEEEADEETKGNTGEQVQQQHHEEEGEENEKDTNAKKDDTPIEQGNVAELFDNFDDINDVLDLEEDEPVIAREGEDSTSANAMLDSNKTDDGIDIDNIEGNTEQGEDNETTEENEEYNNNNNTQDDNAATFVGINQMFVESDDDEEEAEGEDGEEQAPLLTQQEFNVYQDEETEPVSDILEPPKEVTESHIPLPPVEVSKQSSKLSREDGLTREYVESQIPLPPPKDTQSSGEDDDGDIGTESQIPVSSIRNQLNKQSADESASEDEKDGDDNGTESQIPFLSRRKPHAQSLDASDSEDEESDGDIGAESQIPFPPRIKQHTESLDRHTDDEEGTYPAESQVPIPQKQSMKTACSPRKPIADAANIRQSVRPKRKEIMYDSDDDWMRIRKVKPTTKPTKRAPRVQSQIAGEGSEENFPTNVLDTSEMSGNNENEAEEEEDNTGISEKEMQQPSLISIVQKGPSSSVASARSHQPDAALSNTRTTDHRVRFAIDDTDQNEHSQALPAAVAAPALPPPPVINQRELFISVSSKASNILFQSSMACNELASRKRKASEDEGETKKKKEKKFSFGTLFDRAKRLWPSHPNDDEEEEEERQQQV
ncbi:hypothetical protein QTG54_003654 [Skeletonema marinoi]|uniref:Uncharacterized protein n=1 Tax=Skeletonema marinoi TaxID=267567 RepID=A0AAD8YIJ8_9STRA|nr:hypothetical protein QTG54_003654 [Skeletonema marinoi]